METAPLNLAHFHQRRAEKHLKRNRYDEAVKAMEAALAYIEDAYKTVSIPKAVQVLDAEKWDCSRKLKQINIRQTQHDGAKISSTVPQSEHQPPEIRQDNAPESTTTSIDRAIESFDAKYTTSTLESLYLCKEDGAAAKNNNAVQAESTNWMDELESKDFPTLAPLELPAFDFGFDSGCTYEEHNK